MKLLRIDGTTIHSGNYMSMDYLIKDAVDNGISLDDADLYEYKVNAANLPSMKGALIGTLSGTALDKVFTNCKISIIADSFLSGVDFRGCTIEEMRRTSLRSCLIFGRIRTTIRACVFTICQIEANLAEIVVRDSIFRDCTFKDASFEGISIYDSVISDTLFQDSDLSQATELKCVLVSQCRGLVYIQGEESIIIGESKFTGFDKEQS